MSEVTTISPPIQTANATTLANENNNKKANSSVQPGIKKVKSVSNVPWWDLPGGLSTLTQDDRRRIRSGFELFNADRQANGARFFTKFFDRNPTYKELFPQLRGVATEEIAKHKFMLCVHVDRFFLIFDDFMSNMYNEDGLSNAVYGMLHSRSHVQNKIQVIHVRTMLDALLEVIAEVLLEKNAFTPADHMAWKKFLACLLSAVQKEQSHINIHG